MLNKVIIQGRLTKEPDLRTTTSDISVCGFTIACDKGKDKGADFLECIAWRNTAEFITKYFSKGSMILVEGKLQTRTYTDKQGNNRKVVEIVVDQAHFCESKKASDTKAPESFGGNVAEFEEVADDEELPF
jgi:single-strand DNA-binding protein